MGGPLPAGRIACTNRVLESALITFEAPRRRVSFPDELEGASTEARSEILSLREAQNGPGDLPLLIGQIGAHDGILGDVGEMRQVRDHRRAALGQDSQEGRRRFPRRGVSQVHDQVGKRDVKRKLGERDPSGDDRSPQDAPLFEKSIQPFRIGGGPNEKHSQ